MVKNNPPGQRWKDNKCAACVCIVRQCLLRFLGVVFQVRKQFLVWFSVHHVRREKYLIAQKVFRWCEVRVNEFKAAVVVGARPDQALSHIFHAMSFLEREFFLRECGHGIDNPGIRQQMRGG